MRRLKKRFLNPFNQKEEDKKNQFEMCEIYFA